MMNKYIYVPGEFDGGINCHPLTYFGHEKTAEDKSHKLDQGIIDLVKKIKPDPDKHIYVLLTALGSGDSWGSNSNADFFRESQLNPSGITTYGHKTFIDAGIYTHHKNKDKTKSLGEVLLSIFNPIMKRVELVERVDRDKAKEFGAKDIYDRLNDGEHLDVSMGCRVKYDVCMICGNKAPTRMQYCQEMRDIPGAILPDGRMVCVDNPQPVFFDISFVNVGAAKNAKVMDKLASSDSKYWRPDTSKFIYNSIDSTPFTKTATVISDADVGVKRKEFESYYDDLVKDILIDYKLKQKAEEGSNEALRTHMRQISDYEYPISSINRETRVKIALKQVDFKGLKINIEVEKGGIRKGKDWQTKMQCAYGHIPKTVGDDNEAIDIYLGDNDKSHKVFIIEQVKKDGKYDEEKVMLGFKNSLEAKKTYLEHIPAKHFGSIRELNFDTFKSQYLPELEKKAYEENSSCGSSVSSVALDSDSIMNQLLNRTKNASQSKHSDIIKKIPMEAQVLDIEPPNGKVRGKTNNQLPKNTNGNKMGN